MEGANLSQLKPVLCEYLSPVVATCKLTHCRVDDALKAGSIIAKFLKRQELEELQSREPIKFSTV